jgi:iron complex outermembrane receptor protein
MQFRKHPLAVSLSVLGSTLAISVPALADDTANNSEVITVTSQSRVQTAQAVPIALQVVTSEQIDKLGADNLGNMNGYVPGLSVDSSQPTQPDFSLRGLGQSDFGIGTDSPVGVYVDGVYTGKTGGSLMNFNDVQRIEVLKGPQGTLFGRNSAAGAISIINNEPNTVEAQYKGDVKYGQYGVFNSDILINQPINDSMALRLSAASQHTNGWIHDADTGQPLNSGTNWGTRASFLWEPAAHQKLVLSWEHEELDQMARPAISLVNLPVAPADGTPVLLPPPNPATYLDPRTAPVHTLVNNPTEGRMFDGVTLRYEAPLGWADFKSSTAYRRFHSENVEDNSGSNQTYAFLSTSNFEHNSSWEQEFRLSSKNALLDWVGGVSFYHEKADQDSRVDTNTATLDDVFNNDAQVQTPIYYAIAQGTGGMINLRGLPWEENVYNTLNAKAYAAFGDVIWHLSPQWDLTTGARFTRDEKTFTWQEPNRLAPGVDAALPTLEQLGVFQQFPIEPLLANSVILNQGSGTQQFSTSNSWTDFSPRVVLEYKLDADHMIYGSITKGYQAGGYNALSLNSGKVDPETVRSYELGMKNYFRPYHLVLNASLFDYKFTNLQSLNLVTVNASGIPSYQVTTSDQKAFGVDLDLRWQTTQALKLTMASEYINQKYGHYFDSSSNIDASNQAVGTPFWTVSGSVDYVWNGVLGGMLTGSVLDAWSGAARCNADSAYQGGCLSTPAFKLGEATNRTDLRLRWDSNDRRWNASFLLNNAFDKRYVTTVDNRGNQFGAATAFISPPRMAAVEVGFRM